MTVLEQINTASELDPTSWEHIKSLPPVFDTQHFHGRTTLSELQSERLMAAVKTDWSQLKSTCTSPEEYCRALEAVSSGNISCDDKTINKEAIYHGINLRKWFRPFVTEKLNTKMFDGVTANTIHLFLSLLIQIEIASLTGKELPKPTTLNELIHKIKNCSEKKIPDVINTLSSELISKMDSLQTVHDLFTRVESPKKRSVIFYSFIEMFREFIKKNTLFQPQIVQMLTDLNMQHEALTFAEIFPLRKSTALQKNSLMKSKTNASRPIPLMTPQPVK